MSLSPSSHISTPSRYDAQHSTPIFYYIALSSPKLVNDDGSKRGRSRRHEENGFPIGCSRLHGSLQRRWLSTATLRSTAVIFWNTIRQLNVWSAGFLASTRRKRKYAFEGRACGPMLSRARDSASVVTWRSETAEEFSKVQTRGGYMTEFDAGNPAIPATAVFDEPSCP